MKDKIFNHGGEEESGGEVKTASMDTIIPSACFCARNLFSRRPTEQQIPHFRFGMTLS